MMQDRTPIIVGVNPWLPWPLRGSRWWTEPVRAERWAIVRIAIAAILLFDLFLTYLPDLHVFYGQDSLGQQELFRWYFNPPKWNWSFFRDENDPMFFRTAMIVWIVATVCMMLGFASRLSAILVWVLNTSIGNLNSYNDNAGDQVRGIVLFYMVLTPCGAAWSIDSLLAKWCGRQHGWLARYFGKGTGPVFVYPWAMRLLMIQMAFIYFGNGVFKLFGDDWRTGNSLYYVLNDVVLTRVSYTQLPIPPELTKLLGYAVLRWEVTFPLFMILPWMMHRVCRLCMIPEHLISGFILPFRVLRVLALLFGVGFHLGILVSMEIGGFPLYMLTFYLPLFPWEVWSRKGVRYSL